jgi:hypothetical protein
VDADLELVVEGGNPDLGGDKGLATLQEQLSGQRANNQVPSFPLHAVLPWLEERSGTRISFLVGDAWNRWARYGLQALDSDPVDETKTEVWIHERRLHLRGPGSEQLAPLLKPHDVVIADRADALIRFVRKSCAWSWFTGMPRHLTTMMPENHREMGCSEGTATICGY